MKEEFDFENRSAKNVEEISNSIRMQWNTPTNDGKFLLLVENDDDRDCYFKLFNSAAVEIRTTRGCNNMRRLFMAIQSTDVPNFAIQDSDFARVCGREPAESNYFITDRHDHEMMCLENEDIMRSIFVNCSINYDAMLVDAIFDDLKVLSSFKWYNYHHHLNVCFKGYKVRGKNKDELHSFDSIYAVVKSHSPNCTETISEEDVDAFVDNYPAQNNFEITNGHDFLDRLAQYIGERTANPSLKTDKLRIIMYASFTPNCFRNTQLYQKIRVWAGDVSERLFAM